MSGFAADWLALREPADREARDQGLARRFAAALPPGPVILDLGAGTGANARALAPLIGGPHPPRDARPPLPQCGRGGTRRDSAGWVREQRWVLIENDPALRGLQPALMRGLRFDSVTHDLALGLGDFAADGVTASALLDLAGLGWIEALADWLARRRLPFLAALTVDGTRDYFPDDPEDAPIAAAFAHDQGRDKGLGPALGAAASTALAAALARRGFAVSTAASDWRLGPERPELQRALVRGEAEAAGAAQDWERRRLAQIEAGRLCVRIGHRDLLALPRGN